MTFNLYLSLVGGRDQKLVSNSVEEETEISSHTLALYRERLAAEMVSIKASCGLGSPAICTANSLLVYCHKNHLE